MVNRKTLVMNKLGLQSLPTPKVHEFGMVNWMGLTTLYKKEIKRFTKKMFHQKLGKIQKQIEL